MTRGRLAAVFGGLFVLALIVLLPLRLVLGGSGLDATRLAAREATGSVWFGHLREAQIGGIALGDLDVGLSPWSLLVGRVRLEVATAASATRAVHGAIDLARHGVGLDGVTASLPAGGLFAPLPVSAIDLDDVSVRFVDGTCDSAEGRVKATLDGSIGGLSLGQGMSGAVRCDAGALLVPLVSQAGTERIALHLWDTGRFRAELTIKPSDAPAAQKLEASGFQPTPSGERLTVAGKF